jgi:2-polyprenyl-3-methyl-5-hydroxy-6-metoxy-1,4-benzoquinol methylase
MRDLRGCALLEVGCAEGWFLEEAAHRGMRVRAVEPSGQHAAISRRKGFEVDVGFFPDEPHDSGLFDIIVFNDVFEHLPSPADAIRACERLLLPGGLLVINLPSSSGALYTIARAMNAVGAPTLLDRLWQRGFPSPHISYFNPRNLGGLVTRCTKLQQIDGFRLHTMVTAGLRERIRSSHPSLIGWLLWPCLAASIPVLGLLPPDIVVGVFRKPPENG